MSHQVFISYSSKDKKFAEKIYSYLTTQGLSCWISSKDIPAGADYQVCVVEAINQAQVVLLIFSANANSSNEIAKELSLASKKVLIPTRIEDVIPAGAFQYQLSNRQFIDLFEDFDNRLQELAHRIKSALGEPTLPFKPRPPSIWKKIAVSTGAIVLVAGVGAGGWFYARSHKAADAASGPLSPTGATNISGSAALPATPTSVQQQTLSGTRTSSVVAAESAPAVGQLPPSNTAEKLPTTVFVAPASLTTSPTASPGVEISTNVNAFAASLKDKRDNQRESALRAAKDSIPENLNAKEADLVLRNTGPYRANAITLIADKISMNQGGDAVALILGDTSENSRQMAVQSLSRAGKIKQGLSATELNTILRNTGSYRSNVIALLAENIATNQDGAGSALILGDAIENSRLAALQSMTRAGRLKNGLSANEVNMILKNIGPYRTNAITMISENLATGLDGESLAIVLGDTAENARLTGIQSLLRASKIKSGLQPSEAVAVLKNTGPYRSSAIKYIAENLVGNMDAAAVVSILGDSEGNSRLNALRDLVNAGKPKSGLKPDDVQSIVSRMDAYAQDGMKLLAPFLAK